MANEITITTSLKFAKGNVAALTRASASAQFSVSGSKYVGGVQEIGTSEEAFDVADIGTAGWMWAKNLDGTNFLEIRMGSGTADVVKMKAGESCLFRLAGDNPYGIADTAACEIEYYIIED